MRLEPSVLQVKRVKSDRQGSLDIPEDLEPKETRVIFCVTQIDHKVGLTVKSD